MHAPVRTLPTHATLAQARALFETHPIHHLPLVGDNGYVEGMLFAGDLGVGDDTQCVRSMMRAPAHTTVPTAALATVAARMLDIGEDALVVVDIGHGMVGIVTAKDVAHSLARAEPLDAWG